MRSAHFDVVNQSHAIDRETIACSCSFEFQCIYRGGDVAGERCVCPCVVEGEICDVCEIVGKANLLFHISAISRQLHIIHLHRTDACSPSISLHVAGHTDLFRVCFCLEIVGISLV